MKALKLDASFRPIEVIDAIEALVMCIIGKASPIEIYDKKISSPSKTFDLPAVIVLKTIVKFRFSGISCNRTNILLRDNYQCQYCQKKEAPENLTLDHIIPKSQGGKNTWTNLVVACRKCNQKKGSKSLSESGMKLMKKPSKPKVNLLRTTTKNQISSLWAQYLWE